MFVYGTDQDLKDGRKSNFSTSDQPRRLLRCEDRTFKLQPSNECVSAFNVIFICVGWLQM